MRPPTSAELTRWDDLVRANPDGGQALQTRAWGEFKRQHGWQPNYRIHEGGRGPVAVLFLARQLPGLGQLWYSPKGPGVGGPAELVDLLADRASLDAAFTVKVEPELADGVGLDDWVRAGLTKASQDVQVSRATIVLDLRPNEDALLASFKPKCRYNIRLAARRGITVRSALPDDRSIDTMYRLMGATQSRAGFALRSRRYFAGYWRLLHACGQGQLFFASLGDEVLAGAFVTLLGRKAWYKDGGSVKHHAELMAPHLLQWEVIRWLRSRGVESYDLVAVPPRRELNPGHPLHGLYRFKSGFSQEITEFVGTWDLPIHPLRHRLWTRLGEPLAHRWSRWLHHDLFY